MTKESIRIYINRLRHKRYSTGVMHIVPPDWLEDLRDLIKCVEYLLDDKKSSDEV